MYREHPKCRMDSIINHQVSGFSSKLSCAEYVYIDMVCICFSLYIKHSPDGYYDIASALLSSSQQHLISAALLLSVEEVVV